MRIFVTGSTGFIGSYLVPQLIGAGHQVVGLTRSEQGADKLASDGAEACIGTLDALDSFKTQADGCDALIHCAFDHNFANFVANCQQDAAAITAMGSLFAGTKRPLILTSTTAMGSLQAGEMAFEHVFNDQHPNPRVATEIAGRDLLAHGINVSVVRLSQIHDRRKQGLVSDVIAKARQTGISAYIEEGDNQWSATHVTDAVKLYQLAAEHSEAGACYHATAEGGIPFKDIALAIGNRLGIPAVSLNSMDGTEHFAWLSAFVSKDMSADSTATRAILNWTPSGADLISDIENLQLSPAETTHSSGDAT